MQLSLFLEFTWVKNEQWLQIWEYGPWSSMKNGASFLFNTVHFWGGRDSPGWPHLTHPPTWTPQFGLALSLAMLWVKIYLRRLPSVPRSTLLSIRLLVCPVLAPESLQALSLSEPSHPGPLGPVSPSSGLCPSVVSQALALTTHLVLDPCRALSGLQTPRHPTMASSSSANYLKPCGENKPQTEAEHIAYLFVYSSLQRSYTQGDLCQIDSLALRSSYRSWLLFWPLLPLQQGSGSPHRLSSGFLLCNLCFSLQFCLLALGTGVSYYALYEFHWAVCQLSL